MKTPIYITVHSTLFPADDGREAPQFAYNRKHWVGRIADERLHLQRAYDRNQIKQFNRLDRTGKIAACLLEDLLIRDVAFRADYFVVGSARGATGLIEQYHADFLHSEAVSIHTSPLTTAGNIASAAAHIQQLEISCMTLSMTCSSALHALIQVAERIASGSISSGIAGGVESAITPFTVAQFEALRLAAKAETPETYPCRPFAGDAINRVVLSEGGAFFGLSAGWSPYRITGWGEAGQHLSSSVSIAREALERSMQRALDAANRETVDLVFAHAPGTAVGDPEELAAIRRVLGAHPRVVSGKWLTGHTLGASGAVSLAQAIQALETGFPDYPYDAKGCEGYTGLPRSVMVNSTGFGGNAASLIVEKL
jgi:3-oxoacyl-(acyl-carrier-protein) synthase